MTPVVDAIRRAVEEIRTANEAIPDAQWDDPAELGARTAAALDLLREAEQFVWLLVDQAEEVHRLGEPIATAAWIDKAGTQVGQAAESLDIVWRELVPTGPPGGQTD